MSKFFKLALLPRDLSNHDIMYHEVVYISEDGLSVEVRKVIYDDTTWTMKMMDRGKVVYNVSEAIAQKYLKSALAKTPSLLELLSKILESEPDILAAIQPCTTHDSKRIDTAAEEIPETPSSQPVLSALGSQDSELSSTAMAGE